MKHSVVIGGAGFVGSWVVDEILKDPSTRVTIVDNLISSEKWNISLDSRVTFIEGSAADINVLKLIQGKVDYVYQLACFHGNQSSIARPLDDFENGLKTTLVTLEWIKTFNPQARVIYSGAGCAVAEKTWDEPTAVEELDATSLLHDSPYSISKITGEMYCLYYAKQQKLDVVRVRFQNVYGPREILGAGQWRGTIHTVWRNVIPTYIFKALNNYDLEIFENQRASRDFIYVQDVAKGVIQAATLGANGKVYNLATGDETFIFDLAELILSMTKSKSNLIKRDKREWDNSGRRYGSTKKTANQLGFTAKIELKDGLSSTIKWTVENMQKIGENIDKFEIDNNSN
jgi:nucleoside-diphosphate-sugar epimerase